MDKFLINEERLHQIVVEAIENVIMDNDEDIVDSPLNPNLSIEDVINLIKNGRDGYLEEVDVDETKTGMVKYIYEYENGDYNFAVSIVFDWSGSFTPYRPATYLQPEEGGDFDLNYIKPYYISISDDFNELEFYLDENNRMVYNFFYELLQNDIDEIIAKISEIE